MDLLIKFTFEKVNYLSFISIEKIKMNKYVMNM